MLIIDNLYVEINGKEILHGIELAIPEGEVHALFGPNGSGKSVMIMTVMGYPEYEITRGRIYYRNKDITDFSIDERVRLGIGLCEQRPPSIRGITLQKLMNHVFDHDLLNSEYVKELIEQVNIHELLPRDINHGLSGGEVKKSELFMLMVSGSSMMILDEPDSGVDPEHLRIIGDMINDALKCETSSLNYDHSVCGRSGFITTHSASVLDYIDVDKAHLMMDGRIKCTGDPRIMMKQIRENGYDYCVECNAVPGVHNAAC